MGGGPTPPPKWIRLLRDPKRKGKGIWGGGPLMLTRMKKKGETHNDGQHWARAYLHHTNTYFAATSSISSSRHQGGNHCKWNVSPLHFILANVVKIPVGQTMRKIKVPPNTSKRTLARVVKSIVITGFHGVILGWHSLRRDFE